MIPDILIGGFPGKSDRGFLGWSSIILLKGEKNYLFDTGDYGARYVLLEKLLQRGISPMDIHGVFLSHFHYDHVNNLGLFPNAEVYLHIKEYEYALNNYNEDLCIPYEILNFINKSKKIKLIEKEGEVEEGIIVLETPGHTPGSIALLIEHNEKKYILAGDAVKNIQELITGNVNMAFDKELSKKSIEKIKSIADVVLPGHDQELLLEEEGIIRSNLTTVKIILPKGVSDKHEKFTLTI
ncbi:MAG: MBL fold metallo-hydrolase [Tepidibacillus sp.]